MSHAECLRNHASTGLQKGDRRSDGYYYRCLRKNDIKRLYRDDDELYGYRVHPEKWRWADCDGDGLSVTEALCARSASCAIYFHPTPDEFKHVVKINIEALAEALGIALAAIFDPISEKPENPCHFVIVPTDAAIDDLLVPLRDFMGEDFPPGPKRPRRQEDVESANAARQRYDRVFEIVREAKSA
jgi:hypothetical protein